MWDTDGHGPFLDLATGDAAPWQSDVSGVSFAGAPSRVIMVVTGSNWGRSRQTWDGAKLLMFHEAMWVLFQALRWNNPHTNPLKFELRPHMIPVICVFIPPPWFQVGLP